MDRSPLLLNSEESQVNGTHREPVLNGLVEVPRQADLPAVPQSGGGGHHYSDGSSYLPRQEGDSSFNFQSLLAIFFRRWPAMLVVFLAVTAFGFYSAFRSRPIYQSTATIEYNAGAKGKGVAEEIPGLSQFLDANSGNSIGTQMEILRGGALKASALDLVKPEHRKTLLEMSSVDVGQVGGSNLLTVSVKSYDGAAAADLANAICREYVNQSLEKNRENTQGAVEYIDDQLKTVQGRLGTAQNKLKEFKQSTGIFDISREGGDLAASLASLETNLKQTQAERSATAAQLDAIQSALARIPEGKVVASSVVVNPAVSSLKGELAQLELERSVASKEFTPGSYKIRSLDQRIASIRTRLNSEAKTTVESWQPDPNRQPLVGEATRTQASLWAIDARIRAIEKQTAQARQALGALPEHEFRFTQLSTDAQVLQQTANMLTERRENLLIGARGVRPDGRLTFEARPSRSQVGNVKSRIVMYAAIVGIAIAMGVGLLLDIVDSRIYSDEEAQRVTGLPVLSHVPVMRESQMVSPLELWDNPVGSSQLLESYRLLRANINFSAIDKPIRTLAVTSSLPSEGKSHTAVNLAVAAATGGDRVVLIDLDLRRPTIHRLTGMSNRLGFTSVVGGQCSLEDALQETSIPGLSVLTSGPLPPSPFKILNSRAARSLVDQIGNAVDLVVIDAPPVLGMVDARLIASWVNGTVLVISCRDVGRREVQRSTDSLIQGGADVLGTVLNKVPTGVNGAYNYYGYRYNQLDAYYEADNGAASQESAKDSGSELVRTGKNS